MFNFCIYRCKRWTIIIFINKNHCKSKAELAHYVHVIFIMFSCISQMKQYLVRIHMFSNIIYILANWLPVIFAAFVLFKNKSPIDIGVILTVFFSNILLNIWRTSITIYLQNGVTIYKQSFPFLCINTEIFNNKEIQLIYS